MPMKRICFCLACTLFMLSGCAESQNETQAAQQGEQAAMNEGQIEEEKQMEEKMIVEIGSSSFTATLAENEAAQAFAAHLQDEPLIVSMSDYAGFEKSGRPGFLAPCRRCADHDSVRRYRALSGKSDRRVLWYEFLELYKAGKDR